MIDGIPVSYSLNARNIMSVLGKVIIYKIPTFEDLQHIVYLGLINNHGYTLSEFHDSYGHNTYFSKDKTTTFSDRFAHSLQSAFMKLTVNTL